MVRIKLIDLTGIKNYKRSVRVIEQYQNLNQDLRLDITPALAFIASEKFHFISYDIDLIHELIDEYGPWYS